MDSQVNITKAYPRLGGCVYCKFWNRRISRLFVRWTIRTLDHSYLIYTIRTLGLDHSYPELFMPKTFVPNVDRSFSGQSGQSMYTMNGRWYKWPTSGMNVHGSCWTWTETLSSTQFSTHMEFSYICWMSTRIINITRTNMQHIYNRRREMRQRKNS